LNPQRHSFVCASFRALRGGGGGGGGKFRRRRRKEEKEEEEEERLFKADAVNEEDPEGDRATQV